MLFRNIKFLNRHYFFYCQQEKSCSYFTVVNGGKDLLWIFHYFKLSIIALIKTCSLGNSILYIDVEISYYTKFYIFQVDQKNPPIQGFIQAILLTSVFHEWLSFMTVGLNPTCINMLTPCSWGYIWGAVNSPCFGYFTNQWFSNSLSMHHLVT